VGSLIYGVFNFLQYYSITVNGTKDVGLRLNYPISFGYVTIFLVYHLYLKLFLTKRFSKVINEEDGAKEFLRNTSIYYREDGKIDKYNVTIMVAKSLLMIVSICLVFLMQ
jgi:hypothetical protein